MHRASDCLREGQRRIWESGRREEESEGEGGGWSSVLLTSSGAEGQDGDREEGTGVTGTGRLLFPTLLYQTGFSWPGRVWGTRSLLTSPKMYIQFSSSVGYSFEGLPSRTLRGSK